MFDSILILSATGEVLAAQPERPGLRQVNFMQRAYFQETVRRRRPVISQPYRSAASGRPLVVMTAPVYDSNGSIIAVLAGTISLLDDSFLGDIGAAPVGQSGYFYVVTRGDQPILVSHPDRRRVLGPAAPASKNPVAGMAQAGFEGTIEGVNSTGHRGLMSYKRLKETDWILCAVLPVEEAFAPVAQAQRNTALAGGLVSVAVAFAVWFMVRRALRPLDALGRNVRERMQNPRGATALPVLRDDEIGGLTAEFNRLMVLHEHSEQALTAHQERLVTITDNLPVLIGYVDRELRYRFNNKMYEEWFGLARDQLEGAHLRDVLGEADFARSEPTLRSVLDGYPAQVERDLVAGGRRRYVQCTYLPHYGADGAVTGFYVLVHDITQQKAAEERLAHMADHDPLTGLVNRGAFNRRLGEAIRRLNRSRRPCALMYLDVDHFKSVNDGYGHGIGDRLLKEFSARLAACVRQTDVVGRLGGDEFVILLEDLAEAADAYLVGQKIVDAMRAAFVFGDVRVSATTSIGITVAGAGDEALAPAELLQRADRALYDAKAAGRNTFKVLTVL
jgi:diguanylate cyclase (GGDEF)-like protein/PAS domain S-box-containing protein